MKVSIDSLFVLTSSSPAAVLTESMLWLKALDVSIVVDIKMTRQIRLDPENVMFGV
jgi:hypothetical protein